MSSAQDCCYPARPGSLFSDLRVHFLNRNHLLGGVSVQRHRGGKAAVQGGVVMHFVLQRAAANQLGVFNRLATCGGVDDVGIFAILDAVLNVRTTFMHLVHQTRAERIKLHVGAALTDLGDDAPEDYIVRGPNRITALPMEIPVCYQEIAHCLEKSIAKVETAILNALENTPPELYADIVSNGIYLAGGGALLRGLDKRLTEKINIPFHIAEDPLLSVAKGTGIALKNVDRFSFLMR